MHRGTRVFSGNGSAVLDRILDNRRRESPILHLVEGMAGVLPATNRTRCISNGLRWGVLERQSRPTRRAAGRRASASPNWGEKEVLNKDVPHRGRQNGQKKPSCKSPNVH